MSVGRRLAVLGAGPVGLEAAARGTALGWDVRVLEAGEPAEYVRRWGHVRLFTPFGMNAGPAGRALLRQPGAVALPDDEVLSTASELREAYLLPLARAVAQEARLETRTRVVSVTRGRLLKGEALGDSARAADPFRLLVERGGREEEIEADVVLDCTGTFGRPNWLGPGGAPARGERGLRDRIEYGLPDVLGRRRARHAGRRTLVIGGGHSAATTVLALADLAREEPGTEAVWLTRRAPGSLPRLPDDPLPERAALVDRANALVHERPAGIDWKGAARVLAVEPVAGRFRVSWEPPEAGRDSGPTSADGAAPGCVERTEADEVVANVGYEPDDGIYRQLQVHECYASRGPMKLSAALLGAAGDGPADCLRLGGFGPDVLRNPEPGFFILGMKSYGRNGAFLLRTGYEQVQDVFTLLRSSRDAAVTA